MCTREWSAPAVRAGEERSVVVMICDDPADAEGAGRSFLNVNRCVLVRYQRPECMMRSMPAGPVAAAIVDLRVPPAVIGRAVKRLAGGVGVEVLGPQLRVGGCRKKQPKRDDK